MNKLLVGIDIAKNTLEVACATLRPPNTQDSLSYGSQEPYQYRWHAQFSVPNTAAGHTDLLRRIDRLSEQTLGQQAQSPVRFILEATGSYHLRLAHRLERTEHHYAIINPLASKRFAQMNLMRIKTDRSDAQLLARFGAQQRPKRHKAKPEAAQALQLLARQRRHLVRQRTALKNLMHAQSHHPGAVLAQVPVCAQVNQTLLATLNGQLARLEAATEAIVSEFYAAASRWIESVPGVGHQTAVSLVASVGGLETFTRSGELVAYMGLNPMPRQSGTSLRSSGHLSKRGDAHLRTLFYLCALSASRHNPVCRSLYTRLRARGKPAKVALIAVAVKLVRQVFTVVKKGECFDPAYEDKRMQWERK